MIKHDSQKIKGKKEIGKRHEYLYFNLIKYYKNIINIIHSTNI